MKKIFYNLNGSSYYILFGEKGKSAFLCNVDKKEYIICEVLEDFSWHNGNYFFDFNKAYEYWMKQNG